MQNPDLVSVKVTKETRRKIKQIAAATDENWYKVVERLARAEFKKRGLK